ncbi:hypothetical protein [Candidatus Poriferisodalis sp.]|uniref:hypothetical protein n=1 Tax=Candidatus Poriferisodalis sp. TaxID=3101277 RepID=UPI003B5B4184
MDWGSVPPLLTVVLASVVSLAGAMWAVVRVIHSEISERFDFRFDSIDSQFEAMDTKFDSRFDAMDAKFEARFDAVDSRFDAVDSKFDAVTDRIDGVDKRIDGIDRRIDEFRADFRTLTERVDRLVEGLPGLQLA